MKKTFIVAEIGNTHEGSLGLAKCFIKAAADCGVDAVKFQTHIFDSESLANAPSPGYFKEESRKEYFERTSFNIPQWGELKIYAEKECNIEFISSPFSLEAVDMLEKIGISKYKIPSGEVTNIPLLVKIAKTGKKVLLSSGMSNWKDLDDAVKILKENGSRDIVILQCTSEYPCPPEDVGLNVLIEMKKKYNLPVGLSDHTLGIASSIAAVIFGAEVIERHFTLSKLMYGSDAKHSLEPTELSLLVDCIRELEIILESKVNKDEIACKLRNMKIIFEKSIVASCDIKSGTIIKEKHLAYKKPGDGISAKDYKKVLNKMIKKDIKKDQKFEWEDFK
jgi:N-acetylneuraminate synthase